MREWLLGILVGVLIIGALEFGLRGEMREQDARCAGLYSLAASRADSLEIARDGCAAFLGREGTE